MGNFGNKFRKARESKKLSLDDVSNVTKISSRMLKAIEDENFDQLPGGVFNKGFIRAYAKQVGVNEEDAVAEYLACLQDQVDSHEGENSERRSGADRRKSAPPTATASKSSSGTQSVDVEEEELPGLQLPRVQDIRHKPKEYLHRESSGIPWLTIAVILVIVLAVALIWTRYSRRRTGSKPVTPTVTKTEATSSAATGVIQPVSQPTPPPSAEAVPHPATSNSQNSAQTQQGSRSTASVTAAPSPASSNQPDAADENTEDSQPAAPRAKSASALNLVIRATENSWISVTADGQSVTHETLIAPAHTTVRANREIVVKVGNAAGVTFSWKGQDIPAQGIESEVKTMVFDAEGMHAPAQLSPTSQN